MMAVCLPTSGYSIRSMRAAAGRALASAAGSQELRVRFAPSPTGDLHVGGARTALFNYLHSRRNKGKLILRIEDTDLERSTKESENAMLRDLQWLGLHWDEGPDKGGDFGPYRQSERTSIYQKYAQELLESGHVYRCFCTDEELAKMKEEAELKKLPPRYTGKWATAGEQEVAAEMAKGTPYTLRFRAPQTGVVTIKDAVRGVVSWKCDAVGDFVILRSNGQPVYNFCVAIDDAYMKISHVIRAEEHLSNTLRQVLIYRALKLPIPTFAHVSLILAPDRSKLSKRHGATSVGQFKEMGFLPQAMLNYLALLGWNDGTDKEIYTEQELVDSFSLERITKSPAIFDQAKLCWLNGQHLHHLPSEEFFSMVASHWVKVKLVSKPDGPFVKDAFELLKERIDVVSRSEAALLNVLSYHLEESFESPEFKKLLEDGLEEVCRALVNAYDSGELTKALEDGHGGWQNWTKAFGKQLSRKGKRLFMPLRLLLTGSFHGAELSGSMLLVREAELDDSVVTSEFVPLPKRISIIKSTDWSKLGPVPVPEAV